jgi:flavodoxin
MGSVVNPTRRALVAAFACTPLACSAAKPGDEDVQGASASTLVAYFSRSGNTRVVAGLIQRAVSAQLFEIRPAAAYPEEYLATVEQARQERDRNFAPRLASVVADMARYDTVYLGFPIWGETTPPVIRSFLKAHKLAGKKLIPFITHGGYGLGNSLAVLDDLAPGARLLEGLTMEADQERRTMERVEGWLRSGTARS